MDIKLHNSMRDGDRIDWICLSLVLFETNIIEQYLRNKQHLDFRTRKIKKIKQYKSEVGSIIIDVWVNHEHMRTTKIDTEYFEILLSLELEHIRISTRKDELETYGGYDRYNFEIDPRMIISRYHKLKLEMS